MVCVDYLKWKGAFRVGIPLYCKGAEYGREGGAKVHRSVDGVVERATSMLRICITDYGKYSGARVHRSVDGVVERTTTAKSGSTYNLKSLNAEYVHYLFQRVMWCQGLSQCTH